MPPPQPGDPDDRHGADHHDEDDVGYVPPLPPEDRLWRHPSEVASGRSPLAPVRARPRLDRRTASMMLVSGMAGATLAVAAVGVFGGFGERVVERPAAVRTSTLAGGRNDVAAVSGRVEHAVAAVLVHRGGERTRASAVLLGSDGYLMTDGPTIAGADEVRVTLSDGTAGVARTVGVDDVTGIAVLQVNAELVGAKLVGAVFADDVDALDVGARTVAFGASADGGWDSTASAGVVSAVGRRLEAQDGATRHGMILLDRPFAPGTAGGPLVDRSGAVVGIVSGATATGDGTSFGVATPIDLARHIADQIIEQGRVSHVWLGLHGTDLDAGEAADRGLAGGAMVKEAEDGGPAARAGIVPGDVVVSVDGDAVETMSALIAVLRRHLPGDVVEVTVHRDGRTRTLRVTLAPKG